MRRELPSLSEEIVSEIRDTIPEYARPLDGPYGRTLRSGVERALNGFFAWVVSPDAPLDDICRKLGEGPLSRTPPMYAGRSTKFIDFANSGQGGSANYAAGDSAARRA